MPQSINNEILIQQKPFKVGFLNWYFFLIYSLIMSKIMKKTEVKWLWILSPIWIPISLFIIIILLM